MLENELRIKKSDAEAEQKKADELMKKLQSLSDQKQIVSCPCSKFHLNTSM